MACVQVPTHAGEFTIETFAVGLDEPIAMEFAPDGRLFVAERGGRIRIVRDGVVSLLPFASIDAFYENENGLLGLALDPQFAESGYVYAFATTSINEQRIVRFRAVGDVGAEETLIKSHLPTRGEFHSGGGLKFGPDGKLYFSIGDNLIAENAQDMTTLAGKLSRINADGSTPDDNPFQTPTGLRRAAWATGFRNPFRFCFAPDGRLFAMDVGSDGDGRREEINLVARGGNYGWPVIEGRQSSPGDGAFTDPIYDYHDGGAAPVGAVFYTGSAYPSEYRNNLFHLEYVLNRLYLARLEGDTVTSHETFMELQGGPVDLLQGPDDLLYYCELNSGAIRRIAYRPSADEVVAGQEVSAPLPVVAPCGWGAMPGLFATLLLTRMSAVCVFVRRIE